MSGTGLFSRVEHMGMKRQDVTPEQIKKRQAERANDGPCQGHRACPSDVAASIGDGYMIGKAKDGASNG